MVKSGAGFALQIRQNPAPAGFRKSKSSTALVLLACYDIIKIVIEESSIHQLLTKALWLPFGLYANQ